MGIYLLLCIFCHNPQAKFGLYDELIKMIMVYPEGSMNVNDNFHGNPSRSCEDMLMLTS